MLYTCVSSICVTFPFNQQLNKHLIYLIHCMNHLTTKQVYGITSKTNLGLKQIDTVKISNK